MEAAEALTPALPSAQPLPGTLQSGALDITVPSLTNQRLKATIKAFETGPSSRPGPAPMRPASALPGKAVTISNAGATLSVASAMPKQRRVRGFGSARTDKTELERQMALRLQAAFRGYLGRQAYLDRKMDLLRVLLEVNDDDDSSMSSARSVGWSSLLSQLQLPVATANSLAQLSPQQSAALTTELDTERSTRSWEREGPGRQFTNRSTPTAAPKSISSEASKITMATLSPEELSVRRQQSSRARAASSKRVLGAASSRPASHPSMSPDRGAAFESDRGSLTMAMRPPEAVGQPLGSVAETTAVAVAARLKAASRSESDAQLDA